MIPTIQLVGGVTLISAMGLLMAYLIRKAFKRPSIALFSDGYIFTHPERAAVAFPNGDSAMEFAARAAEAGVFFDIYAVFKGDVVKCGNTENTIIS